MKYSPTTLLNVYLHTEEQPQPVGRLALKDRRILFEYDSDFLRSGIELSPFKLPLKSGVRLNKEHVFEGLFGVFNDSLPDGWGRLLLDRLVERHGIQRGQLTVLDRLAYVGRNGMGALGYEPETTLTSDDLEPLVLERLAEESAIVLAGEHGEVFEELLQLNGSSSGARPKIMAQVNADKTQVIHGLQAWKPEFEHWIIKFPSSQDRTGIGAIEYSYSLMARAAGIEMPETHLFQTSKAAYFGVKRFDRDRNRQIHMHSLSGLIHANHQTPSLDYDTLLRVVVMLTKNMQEVEKAYTLACFNVLAHNRDDHAKNFSFLLSPTYEWVFAPAYDLTFSMGPGGEQSTMVLGEGKYPNIENLRALGKKHGLKNANVILEHVREAVSRWPEFAKEAGVEQASIKAIQGVISS